MIKTHRIRLSRAEWHVSVEMTGLIGAGNTPRLSMTVAVAVAVQEAMKNKFAPKMNVSIQQAIAIAARMFENLK